MQWVRHYAARARILQARQTHAQFCVALYAAEIGVAPTDIFMAIRATLASDQAHHSGLWRKVLRSLATPCAELFGVPWERVADLMYYSASDAAEAAMRRRDAYAAAVKHGAAEVVIRHNHAYAITRKKKREFVGL